MAPDVEETRVAVIFVAVLVPVLSKLTASVAPSPRSMTAFPLPPRDVAGTLATFRLGAATTENGSSVAVFL
ncbi:MAG: hypothetical protein ABR555_06680 [Pyrinomonadaceae bacterium]